MGFYFDFYFEAHDFPMQMNFCDRKRVIEGRICKRVALIEQKCQRQPDLNLNSAQKNPRLGFCADQKNSRLGLSLPSEVPRLGSANQFLASPSQDLASGKSLNQAWWILGVRYGSTIAVFVVKKATIFMGFSIFNNLILF